ncbi:MAG: hypothetical protein Q8R15_03785 [Candidatus Micrarchaeota archaeon]|nr:hypothetical protein [Candidatus Micrarchaeota archaeon]
MEELIGRLQRLPFVESFKLVETPVDGHDFHKGATFTIRSRIPERDLVKLAEAHGFNSQSATGSGSLLHGEGRDAKFRINYRIYRYANDATPAISFAVAGKKLQYSGTRDKVANFFKKLHNRYLH